jgi:hypothetical protein
MQYEFPGIIPQRVRQFSAADRWVVFKIKDAQRSPWAVGPVGHDVVIIPSKMHQGHVRWRRFRSWAEAFAYVCAAIAWKTTQEKAGSR